MSVMVYGPKGCGKTRNKESLKLGLGCSSIIDGLRKTSRNCYTDDSGKDHKRVEKDTLVLTSLDHVGALKAAGLLHVRAVLSFEEALRIVGEQSA